MRRLLFVLPLLLLATVPSQGQEKIFKITVSDSTPEQQSSEVPGRFVYLPGTGAVARGPETVYRYVNHINATVVSSGLKISLTCVNQKKGDEKHCAPLRPGTYSAERKGNDKLIVYAVQNPLDIGNLSKAHKLEYVVGGQP